MNKSLQVLFVEDNPGDARLVREELTQAGKASDISLDWVDRLDKGLEHLHADNVDAVLLDLNLPDSTGLDTLKQVLALKSGIPVIIMTGQADEELAIRAVQAGAQDYLVKGQVDGGLLHRAICYAIERRQAEEELQESEDKFRYVFDQSIIGKVITQLTGEMHVNRAFAEMLGYSMDELKNRNFLEITHPEDVDLSRGMMELLLSGEANSARFTKRYLHKSGRAVWGEVSLHLRRDKDGRPLYFISAINDITDRLQMENALRESERFVHSTLNALASHIAVLDETGTIIYVNQAWSDFASANEGDPKKTGVGMNYLSVCDQAAPPNDELAREMAAGIRSVMNGVQSVFTLEYPCHSPTEQRWFMAHVTRFEANGPLRIVVQHENITGRKQAEETIKQQMREIASYYDNSPIGLAIFDAELRFLKINAKLAEINGLSPEEHVGKTVEEVVPSLAIQARELISEMAKSGRSGVIVEFTGDTQARPGVQHTWREGWHVLKNDAGQITGYEVMVEDITEQKQAEEALRAAETRFRTLVENSSDEISIIAPDGTLLYESPTSEPTLGYEYGAFRGQNILQLIHPDDLPRIQEKFTKLLQDSKWENREQFRLKHRDGSWRWVEAVGTNLLSEPSVGGIVVNYHDITEQKQAETQIQYQADLLSNVNDAIIATDENYILTAWNTAAENTYGWKAEEALGRNGQEIIRPQWSEADQKLVVRMIAEAGHWRGEAIHHRRDGTSFPVESSITVLHGPDGRTTGYVSVSRDITERKQAEENLRNSETRYRLATRATKDVIWEWNATTHQFQWTENIHLVFGYSPEEIGPDEKQWDNHIHPDDRERVIVKLNAAVDSGKTIWSDEYRVQRKDGSYAYVSDRGYIERDDSGRATRMIGAISDITEQKQAEENILRQIGHLKALRKIDEAIAGSMDLHSVLKIFLEQGMAELSVDAAVILLYDPADQKLKYEIGAGMQTDSLRYTRLKLGDGYAGRAVEQRKIIFVPDLQKRTTDFLRSPTFSLEGFTCYFGIPLIAKDEVKGVLEIFHRTPMKPNQEWFDFVETLAGQAAIAIDNAQLWGKIQRQNQELEQRVADRTADLSRLNAELEYAMRVKDEFLANMSHELRTPLNAIIGLSESMLEGTAGHLNEKQGKYIGTVHESGSHLLSLINDVLDIAKIESDQLKLNYDMVDVTALCQSCLRMISEMAQKRSQAIFFEKEGPIDQIWGDERRLKQILVNLLANAVKFTPERGEIRLKVSSDSQNDQIQFSVLDNGIGISPDDLSQIFNPFVQVDSTLNRQYEGTGLGLALVQKLTDMHGGSVAVESEVGKGSRFIVTIPCGKERSIRTTNPDAAGKASAVDEEVMPAVPSTVSPDGNLILLAEDNMANILAISEYLEGHGYRIVNAHDGLEAIQLVEDLSPDLILMDIQMPILDGLQAMQRLRKKPRFASTPIIALTALAMPGDRERCLAAGASEYLSKPVSLRALARLIAGLLGRAE